MRFTLRRGTPCDGDAIGDVYSASFRLLTFLPMLHTVEEYKWFIANVILKECEVTVAEDETGIVALLARQGEEIRLLLWRALHVASKRTRFAIPRTLKRYSFTLSATSLSIREHPSVLARRRSAMRRYSPT